MTLPQRHQRSRKAGARLPELSKVRNGLYDIIGVTCSCGGGLRTESGLSNDREFKWETFCVRCKKCDPDGWPNLQAVLKNVGYFDAGFAAGKAKNGL